MGGSAFLIANSSFGSYLVGDGRLRSLPRRRLSTFRVRSSSSAPHVSLTAEILDKDGSVTGGAYDFKQATSSLIHELMSSPKKVTLVRHGLSTWNEESRVQMAKAF